MEEYLSLSDDHYLRVMRATGGKPFYSNHCWNATFTDRGETAPRSHHHVVALADRAIWSFYVVCWFCNEKKKNAEHRYY